MKQTTQPTCFSILFYRFKRISFHHHTLIPMNKVSDSWISFAQPQFIPTRRIPCVKKIIHFHEDKTEVCSNITYYLQSYSRYTVWSYSMLHSETFLKTSSKSNVIRLRQWDRLVKYFSYSSIDDATIWDGF